MAWRCSGKTNAELVQNLRNAGMIRTDAVLRAMQATDRALYTARETAYDDSPQPIPGSSATISAPHMHAHALSELAEVLVPGARVLDVGCGSGYLTACMYRLTHPHGHTTSVDHIPLLTTLTRTNLVRDGLGGPVKEGRIKVLCGDGRGGSPADAPFDVIHVGAAAPVVPVALLDQLARPGKMFIPVGPSGGVQVMYAITKDVDGQITRQKMFEVRYVPLCDRPA